MPARLVVLASGTGTTLQAIVDALGPNLVAAGTDRPGSPAMARAAAAGLDTFAVALDDFADRAAWNVALSDRIATFEPDLVVLAGFMRVLADDVVTRFRIINTHPSLLPAFPGAHAVRDALARGVKISGVTVHWVDAGIDTGPIIAQAAVPVEPGDDESLLQRIQAAGEAAHVDTLRTLIEEMSGP